jgi:hypothetical protein
MGNENNEGGHVCRFCLDEITTTENPFVQPCICKGSVKNVHLRCLLRWIYQHEDNDECNMCKTLYVYEIKQLEERSAVYSRVVHYIVATPLSGIWFILTSLTPLTVQTQLVVVQTVIAGYYGITTLYQTKNKGTYIYYYFKHWPIHLLAIIAVFIVIARNDNALVLLTYNYLATLIWYLTGVVDTNIRMRINKRVLRELTNYDN